MKDKLRSMRDAMRRDLKFQIIVPQNMDVNRTFLVGIPGSDKGLRFTVPEGFEEGDPVNVPVPSNLDGVPTLAQLVSEDAAKEEAAREAEEERVAAAEKAEEEGELAVLV